MPVLVLIGRILFSWIFVAAIMAHFKPEMIQSAATKGIPAAALLVPAAGILAFLGGLSISLGYYARIGGLCIVLFLIPVTLTMHAFWKESDPMHMHMQLTNFKKNIGLLGGALLIIWFGAGPLSIDAWRASREKNKTTTEYDVQKK
jgi:putative oxidoreductase